MKEMKKLQRMSKRLLSLAVTVCLCMNLLGGLALAASETATTVNENGTRTVVETTINEDGSTTTVTTVYDAQDNVISTVTATVSASTEDDENGNTVNTNQTHEQWTQQESAGDENAASESVTTTTGESTDQQITVTDDDDNVLAKAGISSGSETTVTDTTRTEDTLTQGVIINGEPDADGKRNGETSVGEPVETGRTDGQPVESNVTQGNEGWVEGTPSDDQQWNKDEQKSQDGDFVSQGQSDLPSTTTGLSVTEPEGQVVLEMTPDKDDTETVYIAVSDTNFDMSLIPTPVTDEPYTSPDGRTGKRTVTVEPIQENGKIVGYNVTTTIVYDTVTGDPTPTGDLAPTGKETDNGFTQSEPEIPADWNKDEKEETDEEGRVTEKVEMTREPIKDDAGNVIGYTITKTTTKYDYKSNDVESDQETTTASGSSTETFTLPEKPAGSVSADEKGNTVTVTVEDIVENGAVVGYRTITVVTDDAGRELSRESKSIFGTATTVSVSTITDPTREVTDTTTATQTVETTTIYGKTYTRDVELSQERETVSTTEKSVTTENYQLVEIDGELYYLYTGEMGEVQDEGTNSTTKISIKANDQKYTGKNHTTVDDDIQTNSAKPHGTWRWIDEADTEEERAALAAKLDDGEYVLVGRGLVSEFNIDHDNGWAHVPTQYAIMDNTCRIQYGYCVELCASLAWGDTEGGAYTEEELLDYTQFYSDDDKVSQLAIVAHNGFWGTYETTKADDGTVTEKPVVGSLANVKKLLKDNWNALGITDTDLNTVLANLTAGEALTGTQAAIWKYGNDGSVSLTSIQDLKQYYPGLNATDASVNHSASSQEYKNINAVFKLLTYMADQGLGQAPETITADDLTGATIILDGKARNEDGTVKTTTITNADGTTEIHENYNTDIQFTLAVAPTSIDGELQVMIYANGKTDVGTDAPIAIRRLSVDASKNDGIYISPDKNGTYTIEGLEIAEGTKITLNLTGTQHLANGVYVYECDDSQNFIGLTSVDRNVNLSVDLEFNVKEPDAAMKHSGSTETLVDTDTLVENRTETRTDSRVTTTTDTDSVTTQQLTTHTRVYADVTVRTVTESQEKSSREWSSMWAEYTPAPIDGDDGKTPDPTRPDPKPDPKTEPTEPTEIIDEEVPLTEKPDEDEPLEEIPDDEVPLTDIPDEDVPKTGAGNPIALVIFALSGLALLGMALLEKTRKARA